MTQKRDMRSEDLDPRAREVLREIVLQYTQSGEPISSRSLAKLGPFQLSPATLRNVMADLEDLGFVSQPHTSAGRVPTDLGYRFFINHLMKQKKPSQHEREVIDGEVGKASELDEVMHLASRMLADLTQQVGLVFMPSLHHLVMKSIDLIRVAERRVLVVIVGTSGVVINRVVATPAEYSREDLELIGHYITAEYSGMSLVEVRDRLRALAKEERAKSDGFFQKTVELGIEAVDEAIPPDQELFVEGASSIIRKPDFADANAMRRVFLGLDQKEKLVEILNGCLTGDGLQIVIGSESQFTQNYNFSLIVTRYGSPERPAGMVGIIGPTRMEYARLTPLVEYLGLALSRKIIEETQQER